MTPALAGLIFLVVLAVAAGVLAAWVAPRIADSSGESWPHYTPEEPYR